MNKIFKHYPILIQKGSVFIKKCLIIIAIIIAILVYNKKDDNYLIPIESIRIRIIANSNNVEDQNIKLKVKDSVEKEIYNLTKDSKTLEETRQIINDNLKVIDSSVQNALKTNNIKSDYTLKYGINYFPKKEYKGVEYSSGNYESLVITLGKGQGDNWWCVLFPPLCLIDAEENSNEVEYKFLVKEIIKHFM